MYQFINAESSAVVQLPSSRCIYLDQPATVHSESYLAWVAEGNEADAYVAPPVLPPAPVTQVSMAQARKTLILSGFDLAEVETVFLSLPQPAQALARVDWEFAANVHRDNPLVAAVQASKGWTDNQVDALFSLAATL